MEEETKKIEDKNQKNKGGCPLCEISEETIKRLKEAGDKKDKNN